MSKDTARIRDQLGKNPETFPVLNANYDETVEVSEGPVIATNVQIGNSWIVGSSSNGIVGPNTNTFAGGQQVVGPSENYERYVEVANYNNTFIEEFDFPITSNTDLTTATSWGDGTIDFTTGQVATSNPLYFGRDVAKKITLRLVNGTGTGNLSFEVSTDGTIWESITLGSSVTFTNNERAFYWRATASDTATLSRLLFVYTRGPIQETINWIEVAGNQIVDGAGNNLIFL